MSASSHPTSGAPKSARCDGTKLPGTTVSLPVLAPERTDGGKIRTSKAGKWRAGVLIAVHVLMAAHLAQWWLMGDTLSAVEPSHAMETLVQGAVNAGFVFLLIAMAATLFFGRFFCGWGCHLVAVQDVCGWFMKKMGVRPKPFRSRIMIWAPVVFAFYMFAWPNFSRFVYEPVAAQYFPKAFEVTGRIVPFPREGFTNHLMTDDFWGKFPPWYVGVPFIAVCGLATVYFLGAKGFCTYGCPYGGIFAPLDKIALGKIVVDDSKCHQCGHCTAVCTSNVRVHEEIKAFGGVVDPGCMKCLDCVSVCPNGALSFKIAKPTVMRHSKGKRPKKHYDLTLAEDVAFSIVMLASFMAVRGAYEMVPALFAAGLAGILTFVFFKLWRMARDRDVRLMTFQLKRGAHVTRAGWVYAVITLAVLGLTAHNGVINVHKWLGNRAFLRMGVNTDTVLAGNPALFSTPAKDRAKEAIAHFQKVGSISRGGLAFAETPEIEVREAYARIVAEDLPGAEERLKRLVLARPGSDWYVADLARVLAFQGKIAEAEELLTKQVNEHPEAWRSLAELVQLLQAVGRPEQAVATTERVVKELPETWRTRDARARSRLALSLLYAGMGRGDEAIRLIEEAVTIRPKEAHLHDSLAGALAGLRQDFAGAAVSMERAMVLNPSNTLGWFRLGQFRLYAGDRVKSLEAFERAVVNEPANEDLQRAVAEVLVQAGAVEESAAWAKRHRITPAQPPAAP